MPSSYPTFISGVTDYLHMPGAYGSVPDIPETTTNLQTQDWMTQLPDYGALSTQASGLARSQMAGQVPQDVIQQLQQQAAERGISTGMPGSDASNAAYLRALGLTSLGLQQQGMQSYLNLLSQSPRSTTQKTVTSNNVLKAIYEAAPSPFMAAMANLQGQQGGLAAGLGSAGAVRAPAALPTFTGGGLYQPPSGTYGTTYGGYQPQSYDYYGDSYSPEPPGTFTTAEASYAPGYFDYYDYGTTPQTYPDTQEYAGADWY